MLTIFTPTYNRTDKLPRLYDSLCRQSCYDFEWLIIDDGSADNTAEVAAAFAEEKRFPVRYIQKENGGKHTAYNLALEHARGEWFLCVDSDDFLVEDIIGKLLDKLQTLDDQNGLIAYKKDITGRHLSDPFPNDIRQEKMHRLGLVHGCGGEFTLVFSTAFAKKFPFPIFPGERFVTECVVYDQMDQYGEMALFPEVITICEYQADGYSQNANAVMKKNPSGYCLYFLQRIDLQIKLLPRIIHASKYWCFRWICSNNTLTYHGKHKLLVVLSVIPGALFRVYYKLFRNI